MEETGRLIREHPPAYGRPIDLGRQGEAFAIRHLAGRGFRILRHGYRTRFGEIDLVAEEGGTLVFVEVKTRSSGNCGRPSEAVGLRKRARLIRAAQCYLLDEGVEDRPCRFDVIEVFRDAGGRLHAELIRDAFQAW